MSEYGIWGEIGSGVIGGIGSCWNTPIETIRVFMQRDISMGKEKKTFGQYWVDTVEEQGYPGLFRGGELKKVHCFGLFNIGYDVLTVFY